MNNQQTDNKLLDIALDDCNKNWQHSFNLNILDTSSSYIDFGSCTINQSPVIAPVNISDKGIVMENSADIKIGNMSLKESIKRIEERLNILTVNHELEKDWEELRILGEQYRQLEKDIMDKMSVWNVLSKD